MRHGHERDAELEALFKYGLWLRRTAGKNPDDGDLQVFMREATLKSLQIFTSERVGMSGSDYSIISDRMADCAECKRDSGQTCKDPEIQKCKFKNKDYGTMFIRRNLGEKAIAFLDKYRNQNNKKQEE